MLARVQTSVFFFSVTKIVIFRHIANNMVCLLVKTTLNKNNKKDNKNDIAFLHCCMKDCCLCCPLCRSMMLSVVDGLLARLHKQYWLRVTLQAPSARSSLTAARRALL